jgi:hypothetical protein
LRRGRQARNIVDEKKSDVGAAEVARRPNKTNLCGASCGSDLSIVPTYKQPLRLSKGVFIQISLENISQVSMD